jgi:hypothetical protein
MNSLYYLRFQVLTAAIMKFRIVFWDIPEDNSELHCSIDLGCVVLFNEAFIQKMYANTSLVYLPTAVHVPRARYVVAESDRSSGPCSSFSAVTVSSPHHCSRTVVVKRVE